jgi:hypothetical protein
MASSLSDSHIVTPLSDSHLAKDLLRSYTALEKETADEPTYISYYLEDLDKFSNGTQYKIKTFEYNDAAYTMINSVKSMKKELEEGEEVEPTPFDDSFIYRSVVYSQETQKPLSMAIPRSIPFDDFVATTGLTNDNVYIDEIVEGTMIQLFFDPLTQKWNIATKNKVGGDHFFYKTDYTEYNKNMSDAYSTMKKQYTFYEMFMEALGAKWSDDINDLDFIQDFPVSCCYHFVLQHPMNFIVEPISMPKVYLVQVYEIIQNIALAIPISTFQSWECFRSFPCFFPDRFLLDPTVDVYAKLEEIRESVKQESKRPYLMGWMVKNTATGDRCSIRCPQYEMLKSTRGNHPNIHYHFLCLQQEFKVVTFLQNFPGYSPLFVFFNQIYWDFISHLHKHYVSYYVKKEGVRIPKKYFPLVYRLHHEIYLPSLNQTDTYGKPIPPKIVNVYAVQRYVMQMNPGQLFYYMNRPDEEPNAEE